MFSSSLRYLYFFFFFFSSRRRHTRLTCDWSSDVCSSDLGEVADVEQASPVVHRRERQRPAARNRAQQREEIRPDPGTVDERRPEHCQPRSEERRVGKECRCRGSAYHKKKKNDTELVV